MYRQVIPTVVRVLRDIVSQALIALGEPEQRRGSVEELRLFRGAPEAVQVSMLADDHGYWRLTIVVRRSGESWGEGDRVEFLGLSNDELVDALEGTLAARLSLSDD